MRYNTAISFFLALGAITFNSGCFNPDTGEGVEQSTTLTEDGEECDGVDTDADGFVPADEWDVDGDGIMQCAGDCNDLNPGINPGAAEVCDDGDDNDCDGVIDEGCGGDDDVTADDDSTPPDDDTTSQDDDVTPDDDTTADDDTTGDDDVTADPDDDGDGWTVGGGDCVDSDPAINPGATETCNGVDDDCNGSVDEGTECYDADGDGFSPYHGDCDDANPTVYPGAAELCDGLDTDCSGDIDPMESDEDGDGLTECDGDCWDSDPAVYPGAPEVCDGFDQDCDLGNDADEVDLDGDGYMVCAGDCDDTNPAVNPGATEACNTVDDDCNGSVDEGMDADADGYGCGDCNDTNAAVYPGAPELCNGADDDCDAVIDDGVEFETWYADSDGDGHGDALYVSASCDAPPAGYVANGDDCDDGSAAIHPGAIEVCDGLDNDCTGSVDDPGTTWVQVSVSVLSGECSDGHGSVHSSSFSWGENTVCDWWYLACNGEATVTAVTGVLEEDVGCTDAANPAAMTRCWWLHQ